MRTGLGYTLPLPGLSLRDHPSILTEAESLGYTDAWTGEVDGADGFVPLAVAAIATQRTRLGTGIVSAYTRGPALLAMSAATLAELAPGRFCLGIGAASPVIVENWNSLEFDRPLARVRDVVEIVRRALAGERVTEQLPTLQVEGLRLARPPERPVPIFIAALRERMLRLAGSIGDGVMLNWIGPGDVPQVLSEVRAGGQAVHRAPVESVCRVFVCPGTSGATELAARRHIAGYLTVPAYARFQDWLGRGPALAPMMSAWGEGRRRDALSAIPDSAIEDLIITGDARALRRRIDDYYGAGVDTVVASWIPTETEPDALREQTLASLRALAHQPARVNG